MKGKEHTTIIQPPIHICLLTTSYPRFSGDHAGVFIARMVNSLMKNGHTVTVVAPGDQGSPKPKKADASPEVCHFNLYRVKFPAACGGVVHSPGRKTRDGCTRSGIGKYVS